MNVIWIFFARMRRALLASRVIRISARPRYFAVTRRGGLHEVVAWGQRADGSIVGLIADRRGGLSPATGWWWTGWLPGAPRSIEDVSESMPEVVVPVADLVEAISLGVGNPFAPESMAEVYAKLRTAAESEWAQATLRAFLDDPARLIRRHLELISEHGRPTTDAAWLEQFAAITSPAVAAADKPVIHAEEATS